MAIAVSLRLGLVGVGFGDYLATRIEVSHASNGIMPIREGITLMRHKVSPYAGSACSSPPLELHLFGAWLDASSLIKVVSVQTAADLAAGWLLRSIVMHISNAGMSSLHCAVKSAVQSTHPCSLHAGDPPRSQIVPRPLAGPDAVMAVYLLNPFSVLSSVAGTTTPLENLCVVAALYAAACRRDVVLAALALAFGGYLGLHPLLLLVRGRQWCHLTRGLPLL